MHHHETCEMEQHAWRQHCSLYPWKPAEPEVICHQGAANCPPQQVPWPLGERATPENSTAWSARSLQPIVWPEPLMTGAQFCFSRIRETNGTGGGMMMLNFDRGTEWDYRSRILHVTLYSVWVQIILLFYSKSAVDENSNRYHFTTTPFYLAFYN